MLPGAQALKAHQHTVFRHLKNEFFSKNLGQNMPKIAYFWKQGCKISPLASGNWGLRPQTSALLFPLADIDLSNIVRF